MLTQSHPHIHFSNTFVSQSQKSTFEDDFKMALLKDSRLSLSKEKKKPAFRRAVIVSLTRLHLSILHLKLIFILMSAFLLITIQDHTWWVICTQSLGCQSGAITLSRGLQTAFRQQLVEETWRRPLAPSAPSRRLWTHRYRLPLTTSSASVCVCVCVRLGRTDSDIPGCDPNLFWAATCLGATGVRLTRRSLLIPLRVKLQGQQERGMTADKEWEVKECRRVKTQRAGRRRRGITWTLWPREHRGLRSGGAAWPAVTLCEWSSDVTAIFLEWNKVRAKGLARSSLMHR